MSQQPPSGSLDPAQSAAIAIAIVGASDEEFARGTPLTNPGAVLARGTVPSQQKTEKRVKAREGKKSAKKNRAKVKR